MPRELPDRALLISYSNIESDPRLRRQSEWLSQKGWKVDTLGLGSHPGPEIDRHFPLAEPGWWATNRFGQLVGYLVLPARLQFRLVLLNRISGEVSERIRSGEYSLVVFNEYEFVPWASRRNVFNDEVHLHLDLHEFREPGRRGNSRWGLMTARYYRWVRRHIGSSAFRSRSTVARGIAELYEDEFDFEPMAIVRNAPAFVDQTPSPVDEQHIRLLFHGMAAWARGFDEILGALAGLDERFTATFMLTPPQPVIDALREKIEKAGLADRARIVPPSPMLEIANRINGYDLEIVFYPPKSTNVRLALPNKAFEAVQGRLGLVIGHSPMLQDIVEHYGNGVIVDGWTADDLRAALASLSADDIRRIKAASDIAARELNAEHEGQVFLAAVGLGR
jgi:glycosyltransferase involved in cell wall biosynthesis